MTEQRVHGHLTKLAESTRQYTHRASSGTALWVYIVSNTFPIDRKPVPITVYGGETERGRENQVFLFIYIFLEMNVIFCFKRIRIDVCENMILHK